MSADVLRGAAQKLREAALAATKAPWAHDAGRVRSRHYVAPTRTHDKGSAVLIARKLEDSAYAALMHPPVALALADWLDAENAREQWAGPGSHALAVARAVLREPDPGGGAPDG